MNFLDFVVFCLIDFVAVCWAAFVTLLLVGFLFYLPLSFIFFKTLVIPSHLFEIVIINTIVLWFVIGSQNFFKHNARIKKLEKRK